MNGSKLLQQALILALVAVFLAGCGGAQTEPPSTPDRVATGVAETKAIAATLTAEAPTSEPPTATPMPATETPAPTPSPTVLSLAASAVSMNEPAAGEEWEITVLSAQNMGKEFFEEGITESSFQIIESDDYLLKITIAVRNLNGNEIGDSYLEEDIVVQDSTGNTYPWWAAGAGLLGGYHERFKTSGTVHTLSIAGVESQVLTHPSYVFAIPDHSTELLFVWPGLPPVYLEVTEPEATTPTPTVTLTPTFTRIPTSIPPTPTPAAQLDLSDVVLILDDLPTGFEALPPEEMGLSEEDLSVENFEVESVFAFMEPENIEFVLGFTAILPSRLDQVGFDAVLKNPDFLMSAFMSGMGSTDILEQDELPDADGIGDASAGLTVLVDIEGIPMRMDMAVFRRDTAGVFVVVLYLDGDAPSVTVSELAQVLDAHIVDRS